MVLDNAFDNFIAQFVFFGHFHAFFDMADEDQCGHGGGELVMAVSPVRLIFNEIHGFVQFADIMVICHDLGL